MPHMVREEIKIIIIGGKNDLNSWSNMFKISKNVVKIVRERVKIVRDGVKIVREGV